MTEEIKRPTIASKRCKSKKIHHSLSPVSHFYYYLKKKAFFPKGVEAEIVNTKRREKRKSVPYIEMGDLLYAVLKIALTRMGQ